MMRNPPPPIVTRADSSAAGRPSGWLGVPLAIVLVIGAWAAAGSGANNPIFVPPAGAILDELIALIRSPTFPGALGTTLLAAGVGFLIALVLGAVVAAVFAGALRLAPLVFLGVPAAALAPIGLLWFGHVVTGIFGAALLAFGPIVVGFAADGAARRPGVDVGAAMALNGAVIAELMGGAHGIGLGYAVTEAWMTLDVAKAMAAILVLSAVGVAAVLAVHALFGVFAPDDRAS
jgi:ABC-type nitrate/sulfonate/bicarbonate transport system permease component